MILQMQECIQIFFQWSVLWPGINYADESASKKQHQVLFTKSDIIMKNFIFNCTIWWFVKFSKNALNFEKSPVHLFIIQTFLGKEANIDAKSRFWSQRADIDAMKHNSEAREQILIQRDIILMPESRFWSQKADFDRKKHTSDAREQILMPESRYWCQRADFDPRKQILIERNIILMPESRHWCQRADVDAREHNSDAREQILMPESKYWSKET